MIGNLSKGGGARGLLNYLLADKDHSGELRPEAVVIGGSVTGKDIDAIMRQYAVFRSLKPDAKTWIVDESIRPPPGETLDRDTWRRIGERWSQSMGFDAYTIISHGDHIHVMASLIKADAKMVSTWMDYKASERAIRNIEKEFSLTEVAKSHLLDKSRQAEHRKAPTMNQLERFERTGNVPPSQIVSQAIDEITKAGPITASEFAAQLEARGIGARPNIASTGKLSGFAYELDGQLITAKAMGRSYTWSNLEKRGLSYEPSRDLESLRSRIAGQQIEGNLENSRGGEQDRSADGYSAGTDRAGSAAVNDLSRGNGQADIRHAIEHRDPFDVHENSRVERRKSSENDEAANGRHAANPRGMDHRPERLEDGPGRSSGASVRAAVVESPTSHNKRRGGSDLGPAGQRIADLAGMGGNRSVVAVEQTLAALPAAEYEIGIFDREKDSMTKRLWNAETLRKSMGFLQRENALGREIFFRPNQTNYILADDLTADQLAKMKEQGFAPALVSETSKANHQAWLKLSRPVSEEARTVAGKEVARLFNADPGSTDWRHLGRLPGFTNRKPERAENNKPPFVKIKEAAGKVFEQAERLIDWAMLEIASRLVQAPTIQSRMQRSSGKPEDFAEKYKTFASQESMRMQLAGQQIDRSRVDFLVAQRLLMDRARPQDIVAAIQENSPKSKERSEAGAATYAETTVQHAAESGRVQKRLAEIDAQQTSQATSHTRGRSMS